MFAGGGIAVTTEYVVEPVSTLSSIYEIEEQGTDIDKLPDAPATPKDSEKILVRFLFI